VDPAQPVEGVTGTSQPEERLVVSAAEAGTRLDVFLTARLPSLTRSRIQRLIRDGHVTLAGAPSKTGAIVTEGLTVAVTMPAIEATAPAAEALPLSILYDDEDVVVIDKPAGMVVHPAAGHATGTLVNALLHHVGGLSGIGGQERPGIVHRLDRGTSGVMVVAKHDRAHRALARQFHDRTVTKEYVALVWGRVPAGETFERPIGRDPRHRQRMSSRAHRARPAITSVTSVKPMGPLSLLHLTIGTGRTHQIRVHLSESGHPVVGDELYGGVRRHLPPALKPLGRLERPFLHASRLTFAHPADGRILSFEAALPADLLTVLSLLQ
jgi:23S rRNA pseudouridine1911/1915/1917 synthase